MEVNKIMTRFGLPSIFRRLSQAGHGGGCSWEANFNCIEGNLFTGSVRTANVPIVVNLRQDPFERYPFESDMYRRWQAGQALDAGPRAGCRRELSAVVQGLPAESEV